jgi:hypothetical protein
MFQIHNKNNLLGNKSHDNTMVMNEGAGSADQSSISRIVVDEKPISNVKMTFEELLESKL